ncbi:hypothetical protein AB0K16_49130, partial [Nonomuraea jabiensis]|uniref:TetR/AcrR family transcriptional regulator n=1 Tax=Nonomuraea jabiensis TaxID=882448 RepID=UPI0034193F48
MADEAGMARGNIRHYAGNRDELRELFAQRLISRHTDRVRLLAQEGPVRQRAQAVIDYLFGEQMTPGDDSAAIDALLAAARFDDTLRERIHAGYAGLTRLLRDSLADDHPGRAAAVYDDAAYQVMALAYGHWSFVTPPLPEGSGFSLSRLHSLTKGKPCPQDVDRRVHVGVRLV